MHQRHRVLLAAAASIALGTSVCSAQDALLMPGDFIIAVDLDTTFASSYPAGEPPANAIDGTLAKYLNFGGPGSGFIVIPGVSSVVQSFQITTANDAVGRDPASFALFGTNAPVVSTDNSNGLGEPWTLISQGALSLPDERDTPGPIVDVANSTGFDAYKMFFPTVKTGNIMQIAEVQFFQGLGGSGGSILAPGMNILAIDNPGPQSSHPAGEAPPNAIDGDVNTKYLNFGRENSGFIVTPGVGATNVTGIQLTTANDAVPRDPAAFEIYGTNDPIMSANNSLGDLEDWILIASGMLSLPEERQEAGPVVMFENDEFFTSYRVIFPENKGPDAPEPGGANSIQFSEVQLFGTIIPEPSTALFALGALGGLALRRRRA